MAQTVPIAEFPSWPDADAAVAVLHGHGIKCAIVDPPVPQYLRIMGAQDPPPKFVVVVAAEDEARARFALSERG
ncbi:MAG: hypothetical protein ACTHNU_10120 [Gaiellales bacterium]